MQATHPEEHLMIRHVVNASDQSILTQYQPPYELAADMLFAVALAPTAPLRRVFPQTAFLSILGHTPLVMWFSRITEIHYGTADGGRITEGGPEAAIYNELNVVALLRRRALFVPGIYATSERTIRIGRQYGMPKQLTTMTVATTPRQFVSQVTENNHHTDVRARFVGSGRWLATVVSWLWPRWVGPVLFPDGRQVAALILKTPRLRLAHIKTGRLALDETWLPDVLPLWPIGLYVPQLRMCLPPP